MGAWRLGAVAIATIVLLLAGCSTDPSEQHPPELERPTFIFGGDGPCEKYTDDIGFSQAVLCASGASVQSLHWYRLPSRLLRANVPVRRVKARDV
jgi:hypothetical protein